MRDLFGHTLIVPANHIFAELVSRFEAGHPGPEVSFTTRNATTPDLRNTDNPHLLRLKAAFIKVVGDTHPFELRAIGGGTDAKGHPELIAAGPLFTATFGPPINYHGLNEAAPMEDLELSAKILFLLLLDTVRGS
ncbi:MAG: hypothetical protein IID00_00640 [Chloroflexi bacterium]|nr:hypothetical protein [Chloroflexota bacterium]